MHGESIVLWFIIFRQDSMVRRKKWIWWTQLFVTTNENGWTKLANRVNLRHGHSLFQVWRRRALLFSCNLAIKVIYDPGRCYENLFSKNPRLCTLDPRHVTLDPRLCTLDPRPSTKTQTRLEIYPPIFFGNQMVIGDGSSLFCPR